MTELSDDVRVGILGSLLRGMSLDYAARADGLTVDQAEEIARAAGWPADMTAVYAERQRLLGRPTTVPVTGPLVGCSTVGARCNPVTCDGRHPFTCCSSCEPGDHCGCCAQFDPSPFWDTPEEADAELARALELKTPNTWCRELGITVLDPDGWRGYDYRPWGDPITREEFERRAAVSTCNHRVRPDPAADYVARAVEPIETALNAELDLPPGVRVEFDTTPLLTEREQDERAYSDAVRATSETVQEQPLEPLPPATDSPAQPSVKRSTTRPGTLPCEGCGRGVTREYVERTGVQRHGHCREGS